ncbi:MAG: glucose-6-phosphate isomerase [Candidatus Binatia bacterium]|nr:MAG: glucose-6-phosphate isomerase [Candidatus Binatia bacterium]
MPDYRRRAAKEAMSLRFDFRGVFHPGFGEPVSPSEATRDLRAPAQAAHERLHARYRAGELPQLAWVAQRTGLAAVKQLAEELRQRAKTLVIVGSGGTALAAHALARSVVPSSMHVAFADSIDPDPLGRLLDELDLSTTVFVLVSKSGETPETLAQFLVIRDLLLRHLGAVDYIHHLVVATDADQGALRQIVHDEGFRSVAIPAGVSDRFAVLSPASLLPAAIAGMRVDDLLAGASWMEARCQEADVWRNPALLLAAWLHRAYRQQGLRHIVFVPFCQSLAAVAHWASELFVEALGHPANHGPQPGLLSWVPSAGRCGDPYLLAQTLARRPQDTVGIFLAAADHGRDLSVAEAYHDLEAISYLGGNTLGQMLQQSERSLEAFLRRERQWHIVTRWPQVNPFTLGQWLYAMEKAVLYLAELLQVQSATAPGSDDWRRLLYGALGRKGFESEREEVERLGRDEESQWVL